VSGMPSVVSLINLAVLAQGDLSPKYHYTHPFIQPLPIWDYWYLLLLPLCAGISIVYKSIRCRSMRSVPREAAVIFVTILGGMILAALLLAGVVALAGR
jgi:hypothetical protein